MEMESVFKFIIKTAEPVGTGTAVFFAYVECEMNV